jgi:hypothetical protein
VILIESQCKLRANGADQYGHLGSFSYLDVMKLLCFLKQISSKQKFFLLLVAKAIVVLEIPGYD